MPAPHVTAAVEHHVATGNGGGPTGTADGGGAG